MNCAHPIRLRGPRKLGRRGKHCRISKEYSFYSMSWWLCYDFQVWDILSPWRSLSQQNWVYFVPHGAVLLHGPWRYSTALLWEPWYAARPNVQTLESSLLLWVPFLNRTCSNEYRIETGPVGSVSFITVLKINQSNQAMKIWLEQIVFKILFL